MSAATARGIHRLRDDPPWIFDDPFALPLVGDEWPSFAEGASRLIDPPARARLSVAVRSRYPEDRLAAAPFEQYVILGAGLDSFAWRRPDALRRLCLYEVDHPATQAWKRARAGALSLPESARHRFVPLDFSRDDLAQHLTEHGFDWARPTLFSWIGTTMYLERPAIAATLRLFARCAPGSEAAMSYNPLPELLDDDGRRFLAAVSALVEGMGEPLRSFFAADEIEGLVRSCGLVVRDHPTADDLTARYCAGRTDGLRPLSTERLLSVGT